MFNLDTIQTKEEEERDCYPREFLNSLFLNERQQRYPPSLWLPDVRRFVVVVGFVLFLFSFLAEMGVFFSSKGARAAHHHQTRHLPLFFFFLFSVSPTD